VSESDILGPIDNLGDMDNLVSFKRAMFADNSFEYRMESIPIIRVIITTLKHHDADTWFNSPINVINRKKAVTIYLLEKLYLRNK